jgi:glycosyltransferase involved in cell wall biosynthesis
MSTERIRILMITGRADPGGGPEHLLQLAAALADDCEVFIASPKEAPFWGRFEQQVGVDRMFEIPHRRFSRASLNQLTAWSRLHGVRIVHSHGRAAGTYSRLIPKSAVEHCVHTPHGSMQLKTPRDVGFWMAEMLLARRTDHTIAVSRSEELQLRRRLLLGSNLTAIPNGVKIPAVTVGMENFSTTPLRIIHVTRYVPQKNSGLVLDILEELARLRVLERFHVEMLGDGPGRAALEADTKRRGLEPCVSFRGAQASIAPSLLQGFCLLTTSRWEGMPLAVLEALAHGLPVVASDTPGNNDVVSIEHGFLFPVDDPKLAATTLATLAGAPEIWRRTSVGAAATAKAKYSVDRMGRDTLAVYRRLLETTTATLLRAA